jgi:hypothetical protein
MKVAFFEFNQNPWHLGLAFEIAQREIFKGNQVEFYFLGHSIEDNYRNIYIHPNRLIRKSLLPESRIGRSLEKKFVSQFRYFDKVSSTYQSSDPAKGLYEKAKYAASHDLIDEVRDSEPIFELYGESLQRKIAAYKKTYVEVSTLINVKKIKKVYTFNGRFLHEKAVWDAATDQGIPCHFHEKFEPNWGNRYWIFKKGVHDPVERAEVINSYWESQSISTEEKIEIGKIWLEQRRSKKSQNYTKLQTSGSSIPGSEKFILFLHSSDDELIASGLGFSEFWGRQEQAILKLSKYFLENSALKLVVRAHPNLLTRSENEQRRWLSIFGRLNSTVIPPESNLDTYQLIADSEAVITFGSTAGIEASLLERPSLLLGPALHQDLGATILVQSENILTKILKDLNNQTLDISKVIMQAHKYAFFYAKGGEKFTFNKIIGNTDSQDPDMKVLGIKLKYRSTLQKLAILSGKFF